MNMEPLRKFPQNVFVKLQENFWDDRGQDYCVDIKTVRNEKAEQQDGSPSAGLDH